MRSVQDGTPTLGRDGDGLLVVDRLAVEFMSDQGAVRVVEDVSFTLQPGESFGLVGESGSGKTVTTLAMLGLVRPPNGRVAAGSVWFAGDDLMQLPERDLRRIRGRDIGIIFQEPRRSLDPAFTVGDQIAETVRAHQSVSRREARRRAVEMLDIVGIPAAKRRADAYPHQFSGGMAQRVMLAIALCCSPTLLVADEPTTALDVTIQDKVLQLISDLQADLGLAVLFISHDLGVVAQMCDRVAVMYAGQLVEQADVMDLFVRPRHPYAAALQASIPNPERPTARLAAIAGTVPPAHDWPAGCRFNPRCDHAVDRCRVDPPAWHANGRAGARCHLADELELHGVVRSNDSEVRP